MCVRACADEVRGHTAEGCVCVCVRAVIRSRDTLRRCVCVCVCVCACGDKVEGHTVVEVYESVMTAGGRGLDPVMDDGVVRGERGSSARG